MSDNTDPTPQPGYTPPPASAPSAPAPQAPPQAGYAGYPAPSAGYVAAPPAPKTNVLAIVTFVLGLLGFAIVPVILGHISLSQINKSGESGKVFAIIGLVLGYLMCAVYLLLIILLVAGSLFYATNYN
ncbi:MULTISPECIES: DUF4190 domain-containing protein [unclassified Microbacterium]|uniref:DUF4190 domain-containing protein n=1 Tax=unclassified Microbacterium TaxID=2609290 RepID=UPI0012FBE198|nr:DUF4190 domain-containing protein [Microbacterium sp. MAH-37]MVQ42299.1 DUF4190 domain-containing protein [Microbacterium sp. MAH-37]